MKTTLNTLAILLTMIFAMQAFACPPQGENITGGACSVKDIKNLEKSKMQEGVNFNLKGEKNLRPVRLNPEITKPDESQCIFCLQKVIFGK